jgi:hypothetical protein
MVGGKAGSHEAGGELPPLGSHHAAPLELVGSEQAGPLAAGVDLDEPLAIGRVANRGGCCNTPGERAGSLLRVGCGNGDLIGRAQAVHGDVVAMNRSGIHFCEHTPVSRGRLYATASWVVHFSTRLLDTESNVATRPYTPPPLRPLIKESASAPRVRWSRHRVGT